jgi:hypothetical protein
VSIRRRQTAGAAVELSFSCGICRLELVCIDSMHFFAVLGWSWSKKRPAAEMTLCGSVCSGEAFFP